MTLPLCNRPIVSETSHRAVQTASVSAVVASVNRCGHRLHHSGCIFHAAVTHRMCSRVHAPAHVTPIIHSLTPCTPLIVLGEWGGGVQLATRRMLWHRAQAGLHDRLPSAAFGNNERNETTLGGSSVGEGGRGGGERGRTTAERR